MIYCLSDVHDCHHELCDALEGIDLNDKSNKLVLRGDYMDRSLRL